MENKEHIESFIKQSLDNLEVQPGISSFEISMKKLEAAQKEKRKKRFFIWFFAGIAVLGVSSLVLFTPAVKTNNTIASGVLHSDIQKLVPSEAPVSRDEISLGKVPTKESQSIAEVNINNTAVSVSPKKKMGSGKAEKAGIQPTAASTPVLLATNRESVIVGIPTNNEVSRSEPVWISLPLNKAISFPVTVQNDSALKDAGLLPELISPKDSLPAKKQKNYVWYAGAGIDPQLTTYTIQSNKNRDAKYASVFTDIYSTNRQNELRKVWNYNASLKFGFAYKRKWMLQAAIAYQYYQYYETVYTVDTIVSPGPPPVIVTSVVPNSNGGSVMSFSSGSNLVKNEFRHMQVSVEGSRVFNFKSFGIRTGAGFSTSYLVAANTLVVDENHAYTYRHRYNGAPLNKWMFGSSAHIGVVKNIGNRVQLQAGPNAFYNLSSMFGKKYLIAQRPYGVGFDLNLLIRIN
jgi:hypothetical protein